MPPAGDDNPGGGSARGPPAFFREWKRMHREATRDGGDDDDAYDEGAAMFAHQVATRSTSLGDPTIERPIAAVDGVGGLNGREMREPGSAGRGSAVDREGPSIPENIGKSLRFGYDAAHHHTGRFVDGAVDAVTQTLATTTLRVAGNLRVLTPLLDTFFEDLDPKTVRLDDRGLEIYAPSKIKQETLTALLGGCCPYGNVRLGPLRIELPLDAVWKSTIEAWTPKKWFPHRLDEIAARAGDTPTRAAFTSISLELLPFPDLLHHDDVVRILSKIKDADKTAKQVLGEDYENELTPKERVRHHRHLRKLRREIRDIVLIEELEAKYPRAAKRLRFLEGPIFTLFILFIALTSVVFIIVRHTFYRYLKRSDETEWIVEVGGWALIVVIIYCLDILLRLWCYHRVRPRGWKQFFESRLNWLDFVIAFLSVVLYIATYCWLDEGRSANSREFLGLRKTEVERYVQPALRIARIGTGATRFLRALFRRKPVSILRYIDGADVYVEKLSIYAHEATAAAADAWYEELRRKLGDRVTFDRKGVRGAASDFLKVKIENITRKLERAERRKDADLVEKFARKRAKFQEKLEAMAGSQRAVQWYDGDAEASYELRGVELLNSRADGSVAPSRNLADCTVTGLHRDIGEQVHAVSGTPGAYNATSTYKQLRVTECRLGAAAFRVEGALALRRRCVDSTLVRIDADVRVKEPIVVDEGTGIYARADHAPMTLVIRGGRAALTRGVSRTYADARRGSWDKETDAWVGNARQAAGRALLWLPLQRWVQTPQAAQFFYERDTYKAETKKYSEDSVLRRLADMNLVLDAAEYETLRRVAFGDGDPTLPAFKEAVLHEFRTDELRGISRPDIEAPPEPVRSPPPPSDLSQRLLERATKKIVARFLDPILEALIIDPAWSLDLRRRVVVLEPGILIDDAVIALFGGSSKYRSVSFGRAVGELPPFRELYERDLKTPIKIHIEALEAHQSNTPRVLPEDVAGELLRPLFGDPHRPKKPPAPHGFVDTLLDTLEITIDTFKLHKHPHELTMKACTDKDAHAVALWNRSLGTGGCRVISAKDVRLYNAKRRDVVAEGIVPVRRRLAFRELSIVDVGRLGNEVPFLRPADGEISIAMDRRVSDGAVVSTSFDVHIPQRGAGVFHLALASLPVSTIVSLKLRVGDQSSRHLQAAAMTIF